MKKLVDGNSRRDFLKKMTVSIAATTLSVQSWGRMFNSSEVNASEYKVFSPGKIGSIQLKNRLIKAATGERAGKEGFPDDIYLKMIEDWVAGGPGLIITGIMTPIVQTWFDTQIHIDDDKYLPGLEKISTTAHQTDKTCKIFAQVGQINFGSFPSGINWQGKPTNDTYNPDQIKGIINSYADAIIRSRIAGFDGIEVNANFITCLSSFLSPLTNKREDDYGGNLENRVRIVREIIQMARAKVGSDYPVIIKLNCDDSFSILEKSEQGINMDNFPFIANEIEKAGFDAIELSGNTVFRSDIFSVEQESYFADCADNLNVKIPVILTGGNRSLDNIENIFKKGKIDFFGLARPLIREPDLIKRWQEYGSEVKSTCINCNKCTGATPTQCVQKNG